MPRIAIQRHYVFVRHTRIPLIIWPTSNGSKGSSKKPLDFTWKRWMYSPISPLLTVIWHLFCSSRVNSTKHWCTTKRRSGMCIQLLYLGRLYNLYRRHAHRDCHGWLIVFVFLLCMNYEESNHRLPMLTAIWETRWKRCKTSMERCSAIQGPFRSTQLSPMPIQIWLPFIR